MSTPNDTADKAETPPVEIRSVSGKSLWVSRASSVRAALVEAVAARAYLGGADLRAAVLRDADLSGANLRDADLRGAYLRGANLYGAYLRGADLYGAYLRGAYLGGADLSGADLGGADLSGADLGGADLYGADLRGANLRDAKNADLAIAQTRILPDGDIIGWKKARDGRIVKLRIPADARRSHGSGRKCRAERAEVLAIYTRDGAETTEAFSQHDPEFRYIPGETVTPKNPFDEDMWKECASGLHFFVTRLEAESYV